MTTEPNESVRHPWRSVAAQAVGMMVLWLLLSGLYDPFHISLGVLSVALVLLANRRRTIFLIESREPVHPIRWLRLALYLPWLAMEMVLSALQLVRVVLSPRMPIDPCLVRFKTAQPGDVARVLLGNSITLTPGTLTIDIDRDEFLVHALTRPAADGLLDGTMQTYVARLYLDEPDNMVSDARVTTLHGSETERRGDGEQ